MELSYRGYREILDSVIRDHGSGPDLPHVIADELAIIDEIALGMERNRRERRDELQRHADALAALHKRELAIRSKCKHRRTEVFTGPDGAERFCFFCGAEIKDAT